MYQQIRPTSRWVILGTMVALFFLSACNAVEAIPVREPTERSTAVYAEASCEFDVPDGRDVTCGWLTVPEDRNNPDDDRTIRLHVAQFASDSDNPAPDPIVHLEGGPGGEALEMVPFTFEILYARYLTNHDFIMFDQRGTGYSEPSLACPETRQLELDLLEQDVTADAATDLTIASLVACRDRLLADGVNLAAYNSAANAADLQALRVALGYAEWNLLGLSYGTRLAQTAMRDHPDGIRSVILDSTYPLAANLLTETPGNMARAYAKLFAGCAEEPICNEAYPNLEETFFNLVDKHNEEKIELTITNLSTGEMYDTVVSGDDLLGVLFQTLYTTQIIPGLPQLIYDIAAGDYATLSALLSAYLRDGEFFSMGMHFSVQCHEENIFTAEAEVVAAVAKYPDLAGNFSHSTLSGPPALAVCNLWGAGAADPIENEPILSDIPTLILAGEYDPVTPPAWGEQVKSHLSNAAYFEFPGTGHGVSISGACALELVEAFLADPYSDLDASCLATVGAPEFTVPNDSNEVITLRPFENSDLGIAGVIPDGWEMAGPGVYARGKSALDQTVIIQQATPSASVEQLLGRLSSQFGWAEVPESNGTYAAISRTWTLYEAEVQGLPATIGFAEEVGTTLFVLLISAANEQESLVNQIFYPVLDALTIE